MADWEAVLRIHRYPISDWAPLVEEAMLLFFTVTEQIKPEKTEGPFEQPDLDAYLKETIEVYRIKNQEFAEQWPN